MKFIFPYFEDDDREFYIPNNIKKLFSNEELEILNRYGEWMNSLAEGHIQPTTDLQVQFVNVFQKQFFPSTKYEVVWIKYREIFNFYIQTTQMIKECYAKTEIQLSMIFDNLDKSHALESFKSNVRTKVALLDESKKYFFDNIFSNLFIEFDQYLSKIVKLNKIKTKIIDQIKSEKFCFKTLNDFENAFKAEAVDVCSYLEQWLPMAYQASQAYKDYRNAEQQNLLTSQAIEYLLKFSSILEFDASTIKILTEKLKITKETNSLQKQKPKKNTVPSVQIYNIVHIKINSEYENLADILKLAKLSIDALGEAFEKKQLFQHKFLNELSTLFEKNQLFWYIFLMIHYNINIKGNFVKFETLQPNDQLYILQNTKNNHLAKYIASNYNDLVFLRALGSNANLSRKIRTQMIAKIPAISTYHFDPNAWDIIS